MSQGIKSVNKIPKYEFHVLHNHAAIWKEETFGKRKNGGILTAKNSPIKHKDLILAFLEAVQLSTQVAVIHCWGHQREESLRAKGTAKLIKRQNRSLSAGP